MNLERALGFSPKAEFKPGASLQRVRLDEASLARAMGHWRSCAAADRPSLRSLSRSEGEDKKAWLNIVLDAGGQDARLCLEVPISGALPDFSSIWPHCRWWQEELSTFAGLKFEAAEKQAGVAWRLA
jgi:hypothetical protein